MATESCDYQLAADLAANCTVKPVKGIKSHGYIMNYDDIDFEATTRDPTNPNIVKALILKTGAKAYKMYVPGKKLQRTRLTGPLMYSNCTWLNSVSC